MREIVDISDYKYLNELEQAHYEYNAYMNIISYMLNFNQHTSEGFKFYQSEFTKALKRYENEKIRFQNNIVIPIINIKQFKEDFSWNINFAAKEVEINGQIFTN